MEDTSCEMAVVEAIENRFPGCKARISEDELYPAEEPVVVDVFFASQEDKPEIRSFSLDLERMGIWRDGRELVLIPYTRAQTIEHFPEVVDSLQAPAAAPLNVFTVADLETMLDVDALHVVGPRHSWTSVQPPPSATPNRTFINRMGKSSEWTELDYDLLAA